MPAKENEIRIVRVYDAPVKLVWEAWTDLKHVEKWWGPRGFTLTTESKELKPGGKWIYTMHGPDGTDYPNIATYHVVEKYKKLVYDHGGNADRPKLFTVTVTFTEEKGKTRMEMITTLPTAEEARAAKRFIKQANGNSTWDRLGEYLEDEVSKKDVLLVTASFEADLETVYRASADPAQMVKWYGPAGARMSFLTTDVREGGSSQWSMTHPDGYMLYGRMSYRQIVPPRLLVYSQHFCDENGNRIKPPFEPNFPDEVLTTVIFTEDGPNETRVTLRWEILGEATEAERRTFHGMKADMNSGWNESFDKLENLLAGR